MTISRHWRRNAATVPDDDADVQWQSQVFESGWGYEHEKSDLPEAFHKRRMREFSEESRAPPFSRQKIE